MSTDCRRRFWRRFWNVVVNDVAWKTFCQSRFKVGVCFVDRGVADAHFVRLGGNNDDQEGSVENVETPLNFKNFSFKFFFCVIDFRVK